MDALEAVEQCWREQEQQDGGPALDAGIMERSGGGVIRLLDGIPGAAVLQTRFTSSRQAPQR